MDTKADTETDVTRPARETKHRASVPGMETEVTPCVFKNNERSEEEGKTKSPQSAQRRFLLRERGNGNRTLGQP